MEVLPQSQGKSRDRQAIDGRFLLSICRGPGQASLPGASDHAPFCTSKHWEARPSRWSHHTPCQIPSLFTALWGPELANRKPAELTALLYLEIPGATGLSPGRLLGLWASETGLPWKALSFKWETCLEAQIRDPLSGFLSNDRSQWACLGSLPQSSYWPQDSVHRIGE